MNKKKKKRTNVKSLNKVWLLTKKTKKSLPNGRVKNETTKNSDEKMYLGSKDSRIQGVGTATTRKAGYSAIALGY